MGVEQRFAPANPRPDLRPIRRALARLFCACPDRFALASMGISEICRNVRSWVPWPLANGVGWHARCILPGVIIDFVYGWTDGIERLVFVKLGCPRPDAPCDLLFHMGFVLFDPSGRPLVLATGAPVALAVRLSVPPLDLSIPRSDEVLRRLGKTLLSDLLIVPFNGRQHAATGVNRTHRQGGSEPAFAEPWLPELYLPENVPRARSHRLLDKSRLVAESIWEITMTYQFAKVCSHSIGGFAYVPIHAVCRPNISNPGGDTETNVRHLRTNYRMATINVAADGVARTGRSTRSERRLSRGSSREWAAVEAVIASAKVARRAELRVN